jgi:TatD DNase family protein
MIDAHAHLDFDDYAKDRAAVLTRARSAGVAAIVTIGIDLLTSRLAIDIAAAEPDVYATVGIHPHDVAAAPDDAIARLNALLAMPKVVAVGEIGLDFYRDRSPREAQERWFRAQVRLALDADRPIVIHDRDAHARVLAILREEGGPYRGMFHCFSGDARIAEEVLALGFDLSFTGAITYPASDRAREVVRLAPWDRLHVETDCPFLTPVPHRGKRNEPAYVAQVVRAIAAIKGVTEAEAGARTEANTRRLFGLP